MTPNASAAQLWLIEGLPGAGKSETARLLCDAANAQGMRASWWREETEQHPVTPKALRKLSKQPEFASLCALSLRRFLDRATGVSILEGCVFQSVLRFLFARGVDEAEMMLAMERLGGALAGVNARLLMLVVDDPGRHYAGFVRSLRGEDWQTKLIAYVERTTIAQQEGWQGFEGFVCFWSTYQTLCLRAAQRLGVPVLIAPSAAAHAAGLTDDMLRLFHLA